MSPANLSSNGMVPARAMPKAYHLYDVPPPPDLAFAGWTERLRWCVAVIDPDPRDRSMLAVAAELLVRSLWPARLDGEDRNKAEALDQYLRAAWEKGELLFQRINALDASGHDE